MITQRRRIAAGNWKMHGLSADLNHLDDMAEEDARLKGITTLICLPATLLAKAQGRGLVLGGQDCHDAPKGAHTGDISASMLADAGALYVILGHSERRADHNESNEKVAAKVRAAWAAGLKAVICIGETEADYKAQKTYERLKEQLLGSVPDGATPDNTVIAYEPVWAIGTGLTPTNEEIQKAHKFIRDQVASQLAEGAGLSVLYGGSVKPANAAEIFSNPDVDGGLVGGASLVPSDFIPIMRALAATGDPS